MPPFQDPTFSGSGPRFLLPWLQFPSKQVLPLLSWIFSYHSEPRFDPFGPAPHFPPPWTPEGPSFSFLFSLHRATQEELQRSPSPAAETPPLQRRPSVRAAISTVEPAASCGRPHAEPTTETEAARRPCLAETSSSVDPASPDLGPGGLDLASLQAERDVVSKAWPDVQGRS